MGTIHSRRKPCISKVATLTAQIYTPPLDMRLYTACPLTQLPPVLHLPHDKLSVNLSVALFRCLRLVGGGWTEQIKVQPELLKVAQYLYEIGSVLCAPVRFVAAFRALHGMSSCRARSSLPWLIN